ncbi:hypothetical protein LG943_14200 [Streptomonospora sp. S1-112]|uniref:Uncharacterized protein n=1 Tax=Streptomonospora mangrovi TaxID=2883123 RepID=A0A9X3NNM6_9ACTN|nr:hypothetical protein [Streptomonospora mangrovi]MDA0565458.1 hypothetical protein [Streptomonospora mangrovi]
MAENSGNPPVPGDAAGTHRPDGGRAVPADPDARTLPGMPQVFSGIPEGRQRPETLAAFPDGLTLKPTEKYPYGVVVEPGAHLPKALGAELSALKSAERAREGAAADPGAVVGSGSGMGPDALAKARKARKGQPKQGSPPDPRLGWRAGRDPRHPEGPPKGRGMG